MLLSLDEIKNLQTKYFFNPENVLDDSIYAEKLKQFEKNLTDEEHNLTEIGEKETVVQLRAAYERYIGLFSDAKKDKLFTRQTYFTDLFPAYNEVRNLINEVSDLNMNAIVKKNDLIKSSSFKAFIYISVIGAFCFFFSLSVFLSFPVRIIKPIQELKKGIEEIEEKNFTHQLSLDYDVEFGEVAEAFNKMTLKLFEFENSNLSQILFEKKRVEAIISKIKDAVIVLNEEKRIILLNPSACEILGIKPNDVLNKYAPDIAAQNDLLQNIIKDLMNDNYKTNELKPLKIFADGKESFFFKEIFEIKTLKAGENDSVSIGHVIMLKNITKFQELSEAKTNFIATISHELKTPIASVKLNLKLLEDSRIGALNEEQHNIIQSIKDETTRLQNISGELLDLTQAETGNIQLNFLPVKPAEIMHYAISAIKLQADQKQIDLEINCSENLPMVKADPDKTAWVIVNMLSNAIRYSAEQSKIIVEAKQQAQSVEFSIKDFGKGIEKKYLDKIFQRFFQIPGSKKSGTGLGLAISKDFIEAQGGNIWVESKVGEGSRFCFSLNT